MTNPGSDLPNAISQDFSRRLNKLMSSTYVKDEEGAGELRQLTPSSLHTVLQEVAPALSVSRRHVYRMVAGQTVPRLDMIWALAKVFNVSPREFVAAEVPDNIFGDVDFSGLSDSDGAE